MHLHMVLFDFTVETSAEDVEQTLEQLRGMSDIPAVRSIVVGSNLMPGDNEWPYGMLIAFDDLQAMMKEFGPHPLHQAILNDRVPSFARLTSVDLNSGNAKPFRT